MLIATAAAVAVLVALVATAWATKHASYTVWGAAWIGPVLMLASLPIANRAVRLDGDVLIGRVILISAFVRIFIAPALRYWMAYGLYDGSSDSAIYHRAGAMLASQFRHGDYSNLGHISGDRFIEILTGQLYAFTGATRFGGFMVFSWMSLVGVYFFYRAFRVAYPDGHYRRYAMLVFLWPSLIFWPAAIGKEAFMMLVLGAAALGAAELLTGRFQGIVWLGLGIWGAAVVRVHMVLIFGAGLIVAAALAVLTGGPHGRKPVFSRLASASLIISLVLVSPTIVGVTEHTFGVAKLTPQSAQQIMDQTTERSGKNGSTFAAPSPNNPIGFVVATGTVLFRPFPIEVSNAQAVATGFEGLVLLGICIVSARRLRRLPVEFVRRPYVAFSFVYTLAFVYAFSSLSNFGILARQRMQVLPMLLVLLCIPVAKRVTSTHPDQMTNAETRQSPPETGTVTVPRWEPLRRETASRPKRLLNLLYVNGTQAGGSLMSTSLLARKLAERGHAITLLHEQRTGGITRYTYRRATNLEVKAAGTRYGDTLSRVNRRFGSRNSVSEMDGVKVATCQVAENGARVLLGASFDVVVVSSISRVGWRRIRLDAVDHHIPTVLYLREEALLPHLEIVGSPDLLMANSEALGAAVARYQPVVIPSIVDLSGSAVASTRRTVLLVNPTDDYGLQTATDLAMANPDIPFVFQESTPLRPAELARARSVAGELANVELRRFTPFPAEVYRDARLLLAPYSERLRSNRPRSVLEAMFNGIPVLARDLAGLREAVGPGGVLVPEMCPSEGWSDRLREIWTDTQGYEALSASARTRAQKLGQEMERSVTQFESALLDLVESWKAPS